MTEEKDFIQAIRQNPNDDQLRLVYANWLEQNGDPERSEFIRIKTLMDKAETDGSELSDREKLAARGQALLKRNKEKWEQPLREIGAIASTYSMGLPDEVFMSSADFAAHGARLFELAPINTLVCRCDTDEARVLAESPNLRNLTSLDLSGTGIGTDGARALAESPNVQNLTKLDLFNNLIGPDGIQALAESPHLQNLKELVLDNNEIGSDGARVLAESPHLQNLTSLSLGGSGIDTNGARALAESPDLRNLTTLELNYNGITPDGARALADSPYLQNLTKLTLEGNKIGSAMQREIERTIKARNQQFDSRGM